MAELPQSFEATSYPVDQSDKCPDYNETGVSEAVRVGAHLKLKNNFFSPAGSSTRPQALG
jgi:hypothetical protein